MSFQISHRPIMIEAHKKKKNVCKNVLSLLNAHIPHTAPRCSTRIYIILYIPFPPVCKNIHPNSPLLPPREAEQECEREGGRTGDQEREHLASRSLHSLLLRNSNFLFNLIFFHSRLCPIFFFCQEARSWLTS